MIYHIGTFISIALFFCYLFKAEFGDTVNLILSCLLVVSTASGLGIFIKRIFKKELLSISNPDDFISNLLVTVFQAITVVYINFNTPIAYFLLSSLLFLYLPLGKLKHTIYFFAARYQLGFFYGKRDVWPPKE
jgi:hypothetical protein